jgi:hypothetical protein
VLWIRIGFNADPAFLANAEPDEDADPNADPDLGFCDQKLNFFSLKDVHTKLQENYSSHKR